MRVGSFVTLAAAAVACTALLSAQSASAQFGPNGCETNLTTFDCVSCTEHNAACRWCANAGVCLDSTFTYPPGLTAEQACSLGFGGATPLLAAGQCANNTDFCTRNYGKNDEDCTGCLADSACAQCDNGFCLGSVGAQACAQIATGETTNCSTAPPNCSAQATNSSCDAAVGCAWCETTSPAGGQCLVDNADSRTFCEAKGTFHGSPTTGTTGSTGSTGTTGTTTGTTTGNGTGTGNTTTAAGTTGAASTTGVTPPSSGTSAAATLAPAVALAALAAKAIF